MTSQLLPPWNHIPGAPCCILVTEPRFLGRGRSVEYLTTTLDPQLIANFLQSEMPIRYAERIRALEKAQDMCHALA